MENKETFFARIKPHFSPSETLDIELAYVLAKFGHRWQKRKELIDGKPERYFEHVRRVSLVLQDEMKIMDRDMIIASLCHDILEDSTLSAELLEHSFGSEVASIVKLLSKVPKEGYIDRLSNCNKWKVLSIKMCDRLDNLRSLMVPGTSIEFQKKQVKETKEKYYPIFDQLIKLCPDMYLSNVSYIRDEVRKLTEQYSIMIEMQEKSQ